MGAWRVAWIEARKHLSPLGRVSRIQHLLRSHWFPFFFLTHYCCPLTQLGSQQAHVLSPEPCKALSFTLALNGGSSATPVFQGVSFLFSFLFPVLSLDSQL